MVNYDDLLVQYRTAVHNHYKHILGAKIQLGLDTTQVVKARHTALSTV